MARVQAFTIALENDLTDERAIKAMITALIMIKGVLSVEPKEIEPGDFVARERARKEIGDKLWNVVTPGRG